MESNTINIYEKIQETQIGIQSKMSFTQMLDEHSFEFNCDLFESNYLTHLIADKMHYARILMIHSLAQPKQNIINISKKITLFHNKINETIVNVNEVSNLSNLKRLSENLKKLKLQEKLDSSLADIVSLSTIPSLFLMFLEKKVFQSFIQFIGDLEYEDEKGNIYHDLQITFCRSLFVSPMFLNFSNHVFYPIFSKYFNGEFQFFSEKNIKEIQTQILQSFTANLKYLPSFINDFLQIMGSQYKLQISTILQKNFFEPMYHFPSLFMVTDPFYNVDKIKKQFIDPLLPKIFNPLIKKFSDIIENNNIAYNSYLNTQFLLMYHSFKPSIQVIDIIDIAVNTKITGILEGKEPSEVSFNFDEYVLYKNDVCFDMNNDDMDQQFEILSKTRVGRNDYDGHFRKLIKESPPIPSTYHNPKAGKDFRSFFFKIIDNSLIDKFNPFVSSKDKLTYLFLKKGLFIKQDSIEEKFDLMIKNHSEIIDAVSGIERLKSQAVQYFTKKEKVFEEIKTLLITILTEKIEIEDFFKKSLATFKIDKILASKDEYNELFIKYYKFCYDKTTEIISINNETDLTCLYLRIFAHRFYTNLNFNLYISRRRDLIKYDNLFYTFVTTNFEKVIDFITREKDTPKLVHNILANISSIKRHALKLKNALEDNSNPYEKFINVSGVCDAFTREFGVDDKDLKISLRLILFSYSNSQHLCSALAYIYEFLHYKPKEGEISPFYNSFTSITELAQFNLVLIYNDLMPSYQIPFHYIFKTPYEYVEFIISGDNTENIVNTFNTVMKSTKCLEKVLKDDEKIDFIQRINRENIELHISVSSNNFCFKDITIKVFKDLESIRFDDLPNYYIRWGFYGTSAANFSLSVRYNEEKFSHLDKLAIKFIVPQENVNKQNLARYRYGNNTLERNENSLSLLMYNFIEENEIPDLSNVRLKK